MIIRGGHPSTHLLYFYRDWLIRLPVLLPSIPSAKRLLLWIILLSSVLLLTEIPASTPDNNSHILHLQIPGFPARKGPEDGKRPPKIDPRRRDSDS